jgi:glucose-6-phosphate isomerase
MNPKTLPTDFAARFWAKDPTLWPAGDADAVAGMLGWIDVLPKMIDRIDEIEEFVASVRREGFTQVVLCGMGGSSLAPLVLANAFKGGLPLHVLDSTHPEDVLAVDVTPTTLFIVASKSGSTAEPTAFANYFFAKAANPNQFVAITDPGSPFQSAAEGLGYRKVFLNYADIGGRFSALSLFGIVPAALLGVDVRRFLTAALDYLETNQEFSEPFQLGEELGRLALNGVNKLTILTTPEWATFGLWLEQLVAESTGKLGKGILPIAGEPVGAPEAYGQDRFFALIGEGVESPVAGAPSTGSDLNDPYQLGAEFLRWEIATATAGAVLEINPFDQPNVQESKDVTKKILAVIEATGDLPAFPAESRSLSEFLADVAPGDYVAIQAYLHETPELHAHLTALQAAIRDSKHVPVTLGYGPRFLHSTGQFHKGGPNVGHFVQFFDNPTADAAIPGQKATWRQFVRAQALGDAEALRAKDRRVFALDLGSDPTGNLPIFP